jgi:protoporphyrinogen oxidase
MSSARSSASRKEQLGYIPGGYKAVFDRLEQEITGNGGDIRTGVSVTDISASESGGLTLTHDGTVTREYFDKVIFTSPVSVLGKVVSGELVKLVKDGRQVEYLGVVCMTLITRTPVVPYYIVNIADPRVPFTGIIGMSNLVAGDETAGRHLTYLPKYVHSGDPVLDAPDEELRSQFLDGLRLMLPDFDTADIESVRIHRARRVQPLQVIGYSQLVPDVETAHPDFYVLNTSQFVNSTLNNNEVVRLVNGFLKDHAADFGLAEP